MDLSALQGAGGMPGGGMPDVAEMQAQQAKQAEREAQREMILDQIMDSAARDRIQRMKLVRAEKARSVEDSLIRAATTGQLRGKVTEEQLIAMLEQIGGGGGEEGGEGGKKKGITIQRRKHFDDDDDDNDDDLA